MDQYSSSISSMSISSRFSKSLSHDLLFFGEIYKLTISNLYFVWGVVRSAEPTMCDDLVMRS